MNFKKMKISCSTGEQVIGYPSYLQTNHWKNFRLEVIRERKNECERCFDVVEVPQIHHKTYKRLGKEKISDVTLLCPKCHKIIHNKRKEGRTESVAHVKKVLLTLSPGELKEIRDYINTVIED